MSLISTTTLYLIYVFTYFRLFSNCEFKFSLFSVFFVHILFLFKFSLTGETLSAGQELIDAER